MTAALGPTPTPLSRIQGMHTLLRCLILIVVSTANLAAQEHALLWKIEHQDLPGPSYLYGTIHVICSEDMVELPAVDEALTKVDRLVFELDFSDPQLAPQMMQASRMDEGPYLERHLSEQQQEVVETWFRRHLGMGLDQARGLQPLTLIGMVMQSLIQCSDRPYSFEGSLMAKSEQHGIAVSGLETPAFQFGLFDDIPLDDQVDDLVDGIMKPDSIKNIFRSMVDEYRDQDIEALHRIFVTSSSGDYQKEILDDRNRAWIPKIEGALESGPSFVAVGAMHLAGKNGVIELLRERGYSVEPASSN